MLNMRKLRPSQVRGLTQKKHCQFSQVPVQSPVSTLCPDSSVAGAFSCLSYTSSGHGEGAGT